MSLSLNNVVVGGNLTHEVDYRCTRSGTGICTMSLAINEGTQEKPKTTFVNIKAWGKTADLCRQYLSKGSEVAFVGRLELEQWEDRNTGGKRGRLVVVANSVQFIGRKREEATGGDWQDSYREGNVSSAPPPMPDMPEDMPPEDQDIPF